MSPITLGGMNPDEFLAHHQAQFPARTTTIPCRGNGTVMVIEAVDADAARTEPTVASVCPDS